MRRVASRHAARAAGVPAAAGRHARGMLHAKRSHSRNVWRALLRNATPEALGGDDEEHATAEEACHCALCTRNREETR